MAAFIKNIAIEDSKGNQVNHEIALNHKIAIGEYIFDGTADINIPDTALGGDMELTMAEYQALSEEEKMNGLTYYITDVDGNMPVIVLTKEEYDALGDDKYSDGNIYLISDDVGDWTATGVVYDNKISGLEATNVGAALDELDKKIEDITGGTIVSDKANKDGNGNIITETYETKTDANQKLTDAKKYSDDKLVESKSYADTVGSNIKNDLLNGAGTAYDTLKELGELIDDNHDAIDAVNILTNKISSHYGIDSNNANILKSSQGTRVVNNDNTDFVEIQAKDFILPDGTNLSFISNNYFPSTGGTLNGALNVGGKIAFWSDNEGGNIDIYSPNGHTWQMDAHNDTTFRIYHHNGSTITGTHSWADHNYQSAGDVTTSSGVSLNSVYNNFANYLPLSGGTVNGNLACNGGLYANGGYVAIGNRLILASNDEGGNIRLASSNGLHHWEIDGCNNENLRIYHGTDGGSYGSVEYDQGFAICMDGNIHSDKKGFVVFRGESVDYSYNTGRLVNSSHNYMISTSSTMNVKPYRYDTGADLDNQVTLGTNAARFKQLYAGTTTIATSDRNYKDNITPLSDIHKELFMKLIPVSFTFKDGESGRTHVGFISQDVEAAMEELGMTSLDFAGFCKDKRVSCKLVEKTVTDEDGNEKKIYEEESTPILDENGNPEYIYSLRYSEFIGIISHVLQDTVSRLDKIEKCLTQNGFYS